MKTNKLINCLKEKPSPRKISIVSYEDIIFWFCMHTSKTRNENKFWDENRHAVSNIHILW